MAEALYGESGFYRRTSASRHFRTSPNASIQFASAIGRLAADIDEALGRPDPFDIVDVGAGDGGLLHALAVDAPARWRLTAVEIGPPPSARWRNRIPRCTGLLVANEWLDNVPCDVVELAPDGPRLVLTDDSLGGPPSGEDSAWLARWWPLRAVGDRAEIGLPRDQAWAGAVAALDRGVALAIDYAHHLEAHHSDAHHLAARPAAGTLTGYRAGRQVPPVGDGSCDLTAHVALDACAAAAADLAAVRASLLSTQRAALGALGLRGKHPVYSGDPVGYLRALSAAGEVAELRDPAGLGGFGWLVQSVGTGPPAALAALSCEPATPAAHG